MLIAATTLVGILMVYFIFKFVASYERDKSGSQKQVGGLEDQFNPEMGGMAAKVKGWQAANQASFLTQRGEVATHVTEFVKTQTAIAENTDELNRTSERMERKSKLDEAANQVAIATQETLAAVEKAAQGMLLDRESYLDVARELASAKTESDVRWNAIAQDLHAASYYANHNLELVNNLTEQLLKVISRKAEIEEKNIPAGTTKQQMLAAMDTVIKIIEAMINEKAKIAGLFPAHYEYNIRRDKEAPPNSREYGRSPDKNLRSRVGSSDTGAGG